MAKFDASDNVDELRKRFATFPQGSHSYKNISGEPARTAIIAGLLASKKDDSLTSFALPCAYNCSSHPIMIKSLRSAGRRVKPVLAKHIANARRESAISYAAEVLQPSLGTCAQRLLSRMRTGGKQVYDKAAVLRHEPRGSGAQARLAKWLRRRVSGGATAQCEGGAALNVCVTI